MYFQIIPLGNSRPGFYRPITISPWERPPPRRPSLPHRRPLPSYNPMLLPRPAEDTISITSERPMEDILNLDLGENIELSNEENRSEFKLTLK